MSRITRRVFLGAAVSVGVVVAALAVALAWRLSRSPIPLPYVAERLEEAFADVSPDLALRVRSAELAWWSRRPVVRVLDAELVRPDGRAVGSIPALSVRPSLRAALRGRFTVAWLGLSGAHAALIRTEEGELQIGSGTEHEGSGAAALIAALLGRREEGAEAQAQALPRIAIFDAHVTLDDRASRMQWRAHNAGIDIRPAQGGLTAALDAKLTLVAGDELVREAVVPVTATVNLARDVHGRVEGAVFEVHAEGGRIAPAGDDDPPLPLHVLDAEGMYSAAAGTVDVTRLQAVVGSAQVAMRARLTRATTDASARTDTVVDEAEAASLDSGQETASTADAEAAADAGMLHLDGEVRAAPATEVIRLWPPAKARKPRNWVFRNVRDGTVTHGRFELNLPLHRPPGVRLAAEAVDVAFDFEGLAVRYLEELEPLRGIRGSATLDAERFDARVESAAAGDLTLTNGDVSVEFRPRPAPLAVTAEVSGAIPEMLALLESPPLEVPQRLGISTAGAAGSATVRARLGLPLESGIGLEDLDIEADADLDDAALGEVAAGVGFTDGMLQLRVRNRRFEIDGNAALTGALEPQGRVAVTASVDATDAVKRIGGVMDGPRLHADGDLTIDAAGLRSVSLARVRIHRSDVAAQLVRTAPEAYRLSLEGDVLDLEPLLARLRRDGEGSSMPQTQWHVDVSVERALTGVDLDLAGVVAGMRGHAGDLHALRASAVVGRDAPDAGQTDDAAAPRSGVLEIDLAPAAATPPPAPSTSRDDGASSQAAGHPSAHENRLTVFSDRAGEVLRAVGISDEIAGGRLWVDASIDASVPSQRGEARIEIDDFRVLDAPLLARILGLGSLDGLANLLGGEGIGFTHARIPVSWTAEAIDFRDARAVGAIGVTAEGSIERGSGALDLGGQIIPAYTLNSALGKVPVIGPWLVGGEGQGVFGIEYRVGGNRDEPEISVNPLSALAPGVLRQMFVDPFTPRKGAEASAPAPARDR